MVTPSINVKFALLRFTHSLCFLAYRPIHWWSVVKQTCDIYKILCYLFSEALYLGLQLLRAAQGRRLVTSVPRGPDPFSPITPRPLLCSG